MLFFNFNKVASCFLIVCVLFFGVYYHLEDPVKALEKIFPVVKDTLHFNGKILDVETPIMYLLEERELYDDPTSWWIASPSCILKMAKRIGFYGELVDKLYTDPRESNMLKKISSGTFKFYKNPK